jgi:ABC-type sulfate transport system permease component
MTDVIIVSLLTSFVGGLIGGMLGVWIAWVRIRREVLARLSARVLRRELPGHEIPRSWK